MSKTTVLAAAACVLSVAAVGVGAAAWYEAWINQPLADAPEGPPIEVGDVAGLTPGENDVALELTSFDEGGNTQMIWRTGKSLMGSRYDYAGAWTRLAGRALIDAEKRELRGGELHVAVAAMRGHGTSPAPNALINTVRDNHWFVPEHPMAVLRTRAVRPRAADESASFDRAFDDWTHALTCELTLNGIAREFTVHARLEVGDQSLRLEAVFPVSRAAFEVRGRRGVEPPADVDDEVLIEVRIHATPDPLAVIAELNRQLVAAQAVTGELEAVAKTLNARVDRLENGLTELQQKVDELGRRAPGQASTVDPSILPARFADRVDYRNSGGDARLVDLGYDAEFEMVLVPGDPTRGIGPFYVQTTEVTWQMFRAWSYCEDIADQTHAVALKEALLRPSPCYDDASRGHGFDGRAVLGVSRRNAQAFCRHVSEQTGRRYRLWTDAEWRYVAEATGGLPEDPHAVGWFGGNADSDEWGDTRSMPVGQKPADSLGLHDFWGNVAEWVMADEQYIRGGSYLVSADDLSLDWRESESQDIWNETYPNTPKSLWWYRDRFDMGFRLVCDPVDIPEPK